MSVLIKIIVLGFATIFLSAVLKPGHPEFSIALILVSSTVILGYLIGFFELIFDSISNIMTESGIDSGYIKTILKIIGIAYLAEYTAALFYDANENAMGKKIELAGKVIIFIITLPHIEALLKLITSFFNGG